MPNSRDAEVNARARKSKQPRATRRGDPQILNGSARKSRGTTGAGEQSVLARKHATGRSIRGQKKYEEGRTGTTNWNYQARHIGAGRRWRVRNRWESRRPLGYSAYGPVTHVSRTARGSRPALLHYSFSTGAERSQGPRTLTVRSRLVANSPPAPGCRTSSCGTRDSAR